MRGHQTKVSGREQCRPGSDFYFNPRQSWSNGGLRKGQRDRSGDLLNQESEAALALTSS